MSIRPLTPIATLLSLFLTVSALAVTELEDAKETALVVEEYLEGLQVEVEDIFARGEMGKETWEQYCLISRHARHLLRVMTMAVLFYEEAPNEKHRALIVESTLSLMDMLMMLDNFCNAVGIEVESPSFCKDTAGCLERPLAYNV